MHMMKHFILEDSEAVQFRAEPTGEHSGCPAVRLDIHGGRTRSRGINCTVHSLVDQFVVLLTDSTRGIRHALSPNRHTGIDRVAELSHWLIGTHAVLSRVVFALKETLGENGTVPRAATTRGTDRMDLGAPDPRRIIIGARTPNDANR